MSTSNDVTNLVLQRAIRTWNHLLPREPIAGNDTRVQRCRGSHWPGEAKCTDDTAHDENSGMTGIPERGLALGFSA